MWLFLTLVIATFLVPSFDDPPQQPTMTNLAQGEEFTSNFQQEQSKRETHELTARRSIKNVQLECRYQPRVEWRELVPYDQPSSKSQSSNRQPQ